VKFAKYPVGYSKSISYYTIHSHLVLEKMLFTNILHLLLNRFDQEFPANFGALLINQNLHLTSREALRCFLLGMLINIFPSSIGHQLEKAYVTSVDDTIFFFVVRKEETASNSRQNKATTIPRMEMIVFDLADRVGKPVLASRSRDNLIAMLIADNFGKLLSDSRFPKAKVISFQQADLFYQVKHHLTLISFGKLYNVCIRNDYRL